MSKTANYRKFCLTTAIALALVLFLPLLTACKKEPINRNIEGHWKLEEFTVLKTDETVHCERIYWGITRVGAKLMEKQGPHGYASLDALVEYRNDETLFVLKDIAVGKKEATPEQMYPYGLNNAKESVFKIVKSTRKDMILESDYAQLIFKKF